MAKATAKKKWIQIVAPKLINSQVIGETITFDPQTVVGKIVKVNLSSLVNDMRRQNTEFSMVVESIEGDKAKTKFIGLRLLPTSLKRVVRKGRTRLDQTIRGITKDEQVVTIKVFLVPRNRVQGSVSSGLQNDVKHFITKKISASDYDSLCGEIVSGELKRILKGKLNKIYPLKVCDIREFKLERFVKAVQLRKIKARLANEKPGKVVEEEAKEKDSEEQEEKKEETVEEDKKPEEKKEVETVKEEKKEAVKEEEAAKEEETVKKEE